MGLDSWIGDGKAQAWWTSSSLLEQFYPRDKMKIPLEIDIIDQTFWVWYFLLFSIFSLWSWSINLLVIDILFSRSKSTFLSWKLVMLVTRCPPVKYFFVKLDNRRWRFLSLCLSTWPFTTCRPQWLKINVQYWWLFSKPLSKTSF